MNFDEFTLVQSNSQSGPQPETELEFANLLINQPTQAVFCLGEKAQFFYVNDATCRMTEYSREELLAMTLLDIDIDCPGNQWLQRWQYLTTKSRTSINFESRYRTKGGRICVVVITLMYLQHKGQELAFAFVRELMIGIEQPIRQLSELRHNFMTMFCHKFRIPLNVMSFSSSLLKRHLHEWSGEKIHSVLDGIQVSVAQSDKLLDYLLFYEQAAAKKLQFVAKTLDLVPFCHQLVAQKQMHNSDNLINFVHQCYCLGVYILPEVLEAILNILLDNAMKYSPNSSVINLTLTCEPQQIIFQVQDTGIGIPLPEQRQVFEPLYRGSNVNHLPGSGLGLAMAKTLVDLYGGQITLESELEVGTTVTFIFPTGN